MLLLQVMESRLPFKVSATDWWQRLSHCVVKVTEITETQMQTWFKFCTNMFRYKAVVGHRGGGVEVVGRPLPELKDQFSVDCVSLWNQINMCTRRRLWHATHDCVASYVDIILHRGRFWAKSAASGSVRWCCFRSCWMVLSHVMRGRPSCLLQLS